MKHGMHNHPLNRKWRGIKGRCYNLNDVNYKHYGERGIEIYNEWRYDFKLFYDYITTLPNYGKPNMTLDRINNDGNYEPGNLRWVDMNVQNANTRKRKDNLSGFTGVSKVNKRYKSRITFNGNNINLGYFDSAIEAAQYRDRFILKNNLPHPTQII